MISFGWMVTGAVVIFIGFCIVALIHSDNRTEALRIACEAKGGTLLDRTYSMGKTTGHNYTCVANSAIIP